MNYFGRKLKRNINQWKRDCAVGTLIIPNKKNKLYKLDNGKLISHRAVAQVVRGIMKRQMRELGEEICFPESKILKKALRLARGLK